VVLEESLPSGFPPHLHLIACALPQHLGLEISHATEMQILEKLPSATNFNYSQDAP
jgi:hypothetical protein